MGKDTEEKTTDGDIFGNKLYEIRAREALPILIRQAKVSQKITYSDLATELKMDNPRNLNYVLGLIGSSLLKLADEWKEYIPLIQSIVVNKNTELPGEGINWFIKNKKQYDDSSPSEKRQLILEMLSDVFHYEKWNEVLLAFKLNENTNSITSFRNIARNGYGSGEGEKHKLFKKYVSENPQIFGIKNLGKGNIEHQFPSADSIDVYFENEKIVVGVEVKSETSNTSDVLRGLFQCKKYEALIEAENSVNGIRKEIKVFLALENPFPDELISIKNVLQVNVIDKLKKAI